MATRMQQRRGTAAQWISTNNGDGPILEAGEIGFETDTGKFKIGDGTNHWVDLDYFLDESEIDSITGDYVLANTLGQANGVATLDSSGKLTATQIPNIEELSQDAVDLALTAGTGITKTYNDNANTITIAVDTSVIATKAELAEVSQDSINDALTAGTGISKSYNDNANTITISTSNVPNSALANSSVTINGFSISLGGSATYSSDNIGEGTTNLYFSNARAQAALASDLSNKQDKVSGVSDTEIGYLDGVTSNVQAQLDSKLSSATAASTYQPLVSGVSNTEIGYLDGVTSNVQAQIDTKLASSTAASTYAPIASPTFTGTVSGVTKSMVGLGNVDNTSDANKPVSTATQTALDLKANLASPTFTGTVTLPSGTVTSAMIADETIVNADIANTAAIAQSKISNLTTDLAAKANLSGAAFTGNVSTTANFTVDGNFTVNGSNVLVSATQIQIEDSLIQLGHQNPANTVDLGFFAGYNDGTAKHSGLVKDATDAKWKLFKGVTTEPSTTVDFTQATLDDLSVGALEASSLTVGSVSNTEIGYLDGLTSNVQAQLDSKLSSSTAASTYQPLVSGVSNTEIGYLDGVTSNVQAQLDTKLASSTAASTYAPIASPTFTGTVTLPTGTVTSGMILDGTIVNGDISNTAAIAYGKLSLTNSIVNADISSSASIALSKLASGTSGQIIVANSSGVPTWVSETGDITISDTGVTAIASGVIVNADISASAAIDKTKISGNAITAADTGTVTNTMLAGSIANSKLANASVTINGSAVALGGSVTISAAPTPSAVSSNVTAQANYNYFVDTTAARTITLPASPALGDTIAIWDASGSAATNNITVARNGNKINGLSDDALIDVNQAVSQFVYTGNTIGWKFD
jgi:hypothetical protein